MSGYCLINLILLSSKDKSDINLHDKSSNGCVVVVFKYFLLPTK